MDLEGRNVVLTGASGGIGRAIAERLAADGARLLLVARDVQRLAQLCAGLAGGGHAFVAADIGTAAGRATVLAHCHQQDGGVSALINSAGANAFGLFEQQSQQAVIDLININLTSTMLLCQDMLPLLQAQAQSRIVNIGSTFGSIGYPGFAAYCASKFGLRGFTEALRRELADSSVQVSYIAPRATRTALNSDKVVAMNEALGTAMDEPAVVAGQVAEFIRRRSRSDEYLGWPEKLFVRVNAILPRLVDKSLRKQLPVIRRFARS